MKSMGKEKEEKFYFVSYFDGNESKLPNKQIVRFEELLNSVCRSGKVMPPDNLSFVFLVRYLTNKTVAIDPTRCRYKNSFHAEFIAKNAFVRMLGKDLRNNNAIKVFILANDGELTSSSDSEEFNIDMRNLSLCTDLKKEFRNDIYIVAEVINPDYYEVFDYVADEVICGKIITNKIIPNALLVRDYPIVVRNLISLDTIPSIFTVRIENNSETRKFIGKRYGAVKEYLLSANSSSNLIGIITFKNNEKDTGKEIELEINPVSNTQSARMEKFKNTVKYFFRRILLIEDGRSDVRRLSFNYKFKEGDFLIVIACDYKSLKDSISNSASKLSLQRS